MGRGLEKRINEEVLIYVYSNMNLQELPSEIIAIGNEKFNFLLLRIIEIIHDNLAYYHSVQIDKNFDKDSCSLNIIFQQNDILLFTFNILEYKQVNIKFDKAVGVKTDRFKQIVYNIN